MVDICQARSEWARMDEDARVDFMRDAVNEMLDRQGLGGDVDVQIYDAPDNELAEWDYEDNTIRVDRARTVYEDDFETVLDTAYHEGLHAAMDKANGGATDIGDRVSEGYVFEYVYDDETLTLFPPGTTVPGEVHIQQVYRVAAQMARQEMDRCRQHDEYGSARDIADDEGFEFSEDDLDDDDDDDDAGSAAAPPGDGLLMEMGEPIVRDGDNDDGLLIEMLDEQAQVSPAPPPPSPPSPPSPPPGP